MKTKLILLLCTTAIASTASASSLTQMVRDVVQINQPIPDSGIAIAIVKQGKIVFESGFGQRDRGNNLPVDIETLFAVGSITKSFTSTLISQQAHDRILNLASPVNSLTRNFHLQLQNEHITDAMTLTDMLSHQTGLPRHDMLIFLTPFGTQELFSRMRFLTFNPTPGMGFREGWQYNNLMYMAAGSLSAIVARRPWEALAQDYLLSPIGMRSANFSLKKTIDTGNYVHGYLGFREQKLFELKQVAPAGALNASVRDMALWIQMHLNRGLNQRGRKVVHADALEATYKPRVKIPQEYYPFLPPGQLWHYGLGWFVGEIAGERILVHGGNTVGVTSLVSFMPERNLGLVILINQTASQFPAKAAGVIYDYLLSEDGSDKTFVNSDLSKYFGVPIILDHSSMEHNDTQSNIPYSQAYGCQGSFSDKGYGHLSLYSFEKDAVLSYYGSSWIVRLNDKNEFALPIKLFGSAVEIAGQIVTDSSKACSAVELQLEPETRPIRFLRATESTAPFEPLASRIKKR